MGAMVGESNIPKRFIDGLHASADIKKVRGPFGRHVDGFNDGSQNFVFDWFRVLTRFVSSEGLLIYFVFPHEQEVDAFIAALTH